MTDTIKPVAWMVTTELYSNQHIARLHGVPVPLFSGSDLDRAALQRAVNVVRGSLERWKHHGGQVISENFVPEYERVIGEYEETIAHLTALLGVATQEK